MLSVGMDLSIELDRDGVVKKYKSKIADLHETTFFIYYPISVIEKRIAFLPAGSKVAVSFISDHTTVFSFESKVTGSQKNTVPLLELSLPEKENVKRIQRREHVRVNAGVKVNLHFPESGKIINTVTSNISAGGCAVIIPEEATVKEGETGTIELAIHTESKGLVQLSFFFEIIRLFETNNLNLISLKYIEPNRNDQQLLTRYCFERQLADRKKGLEA